jgi:ribose 5-phosphate isomerase RpiB
MRIGIAADHGGFEWKVQLIAALNANGYKLYSHSIKPLQPYNQRACYLLILQKC